jgi:hypothetical protein
MSYSTPLARAIGPVLVAGVLHTLFDPDDDRIEPGGAMGIDRGEHRAVDAGRIERMNRVGRGRGV